MSKFKIEDTFKKEIDLIWNDEKYQNVPFIERGYALQSEIPYSSILFIGINPSFNEIKTIEKESFFYNNEGKELIHKYFKRFREISEKIKINWSHLDLLYIRETDQKKVKSIFKNEIGRLFLLEQLMISKKIIENSKPKIIVVSNTLARDLFLQECKFEIFFDDTIGTHRIINNTQLEGIPVFFTSMLTGQRALDNGSYVRLVWHIKFVLNKLENGKKLQFEIGSN